MSSVLCYRPIVEQEQLYFLYLVKELQEKQHDAAPKRTKNKQPWLKLLPNSSYPLLSYLHVSRFLCFKGIAVFITPSLPWFTLSPLKPWPLSAKPRPLEPYLSLTYNALVFVGCLPPGTVTFNDNFNFEVNGLGQLYYGLLRMNFPICPLETLPFVVNDMWAHLHWQNGKANCLNWQDCKWLLIVGGTMGTYGAAKGKPESIADQWGQLAREWESTV